MNREDLEMGEGRTAEEKLICGLEHWGMQLSTQQLEQLHQYYENLVRWNAVMNLTAITEEADVYEKHFLDSLSISEILNDLSAVRRVIDVGTGSGILALGAALSGAGDVLAIDIDPDAVRVASKNVEHHGLSDLIRVREGNLLNQVSEVCDICVANIIADIILTLASPLKNHIRPGGLFICSGIIVERADEIRKVLTEAGYEILEEKCTEEWAAFCARRSL